MKTKGWTITVHQNIGWYYGLDNGNLHLWEGYNEEFHCLLSSGRYKNAGEMYWSTNGESFANPNDAVDNQLKIANEFVLKVMGVVTKLEKSLKGE
jgi:hypothetical protein